MLIGRLTREPELRYTPGSGTAVTTCSLAVDRRPTKEGKKEADFINCVAFGRVAENIAQYVTKGRMFAIAGRIQSSSYEGKDGTKRYRTDVVIEEIQFIDSRKEQQPKQEGTYEYDENIIPIDDGEMPFNY